MFMNDLYHFVGYMIFSSLEYFSIFLIIFSFFRLYPEYFKREIIYLTLGTTFVSYLLVIMDIHRLVPLPLIITPVVIVILKKVLDRNLSYSIISTIFGFVFYLGMQSLIMWLALDFKLITQIEISDPFSIKTYSIQCLCSSIGVAIALYIKIFKGGFNFSFKTSKNSYMNFLFVTIVLGMLASMTFTSFVITGLFSIIILLACVSVISVIVIAYFSKKREDIEYS